MIGKISDILTEKERTYSFELFPPKTQRGREKLPETAGILKELEPDWFAVTYGAGGTTRELTMDIVDELQKRFQIPIMHHFTCVGHSKAELEAIIKKMKNICFPSLSTLIVIGRHNIQASALFYLRSPVLGQPCSMCRNVVLVPHLQVAHYTAQLRTEHQPYR